MRRTSCTMDGFCLLYLLMILLVRSGDVETNPGPDRIVSEREFFKLSKQIDPSYYKEVGINFDIPYAELGQIEKESQNTSDALMTVFTRWRDKQPPGTDIRALLAEELERSGLGSLSGELLAGSLVPARTGAPATMPGSQPRPLSPDLIKRCADDFKFKYRTSLCKIRADPLNPDSIVPFNDMYTNLVLEEGYRDHKRPLEYRDLFDLKVNGEFPKRIMVQGEAGAGKTTFCAKIAWDWINDSPALSKFVWVLVVPFREAKKYKIGEIAKSYLPKDNPATACQITEYIRSNPKDVFIAFDGLDEFDGKIVQQRKASPKSECLLPKSADQTKARSESKTNKNKWQKLMQPKSGSPTSATSQPSVNSAEACGSSSERGDIALEDILCSDELATCPVLVTSRPWKVTEIRWDNRLRKLYTFIHVEGFSKKNVEVYIHKYFEDDVGTADQLIQLTKVNEIISENMAPYPIYIAMLCLMWRELDDKKQEKFKSFQTFSQIFDEMFEFLKVHYAQKKITDLGSLSFQVYCSQIEKLMEPVSKVAFIGLQEKTLIFKEDDFEQCSDSIETACRVGVLSQENKLSSMNVKSSRFLQSTIFFPHKLFQEYMAGIYLASLYELDHNEFTRMIEQVVLPRKEEFIYLLYFTVSRDKAIAQHVMKCMVQGDTTSYMELNFLVDVSFESQDLDTAALVRGGMSSLTFETVHTVAGYVFTGLYKDVIKLTVKFRASGPITSHDVAKIICSVPSLKVVTLQSLAFHSDFYKILAKEGNKSTVKTLKLEDVRCPSSASSHPLAEALCSMPNLNNLKIWGSNFEEEFYSTLNTKASTLQVQTLKLFDVRCSTSAFSHHLAEALCSMPYLTDLTLGGEEFEEEFYSTLKAKASTLQVKDLCLLGHEFPTPTSSKNLAESLCSMPNLTVLKCNNMCLIEEFCSTLILVASNIKGSFPKVREGGFWFNDHRQADFDSFLQSLTNCQREDVCDPEYLYIFMDYLSNDEDGVSEEEDCFSEEEDCFSDEEDGVLDKEDGVSDKENGVLDEEDDVSDEEENVSDEEDNTSDEEDNTSSDEEDNVSDEEENVSDEEDNTSDEEDNTSSDEEDNVSDEKRLPEGKGDINLVDRKQSSFEVKPLESEIIQKFLKFPLDQKPILNEFSLPYNDMETTRTTAEAQAARVSTLSQIDLESGRTLPPSDYPQQYVGNTSDTVCQLSQTYREGSRSQSRPLKKKAPSTQSRAPQDDPEVPEKQSKIDLESDGILNTLSKHMPPGSYATLCTHLCIGYYEANFILARFNMDYQRATRDCLAQWKTRTGGNMDELETIIQDAEVGDLVKYIE